MDETMQKHISIKFFKTRNKEKKSYQNSSKILIDIDKLFQSLYGKQRNYNS